MRISELSRAADVPVATVKYYLREGLLHEGRRTSATQAQYDDSHVARLRLVRSLVGGAGLSVSTARELLGHLDRPPESLHGLFGVVLDLVDDTAGDDLDLTAAQRVIDDLGWRVDAEHDRGRVRQLARALATLEAADFSLPADALASYADDARRMAEREIAGVPTESAEAAVRYVVLGTILVEPLLLALRRLAEADASARAFGDP